MTAWLSLCALLLLPAAPRAATPHPVPPPAPPPAPTPAPPPASPAADLSIRPLPDAATTSSPASTSWKIDAAFSETELQNVTRAAGAGAGGGGAGADAGGGGAGADAGGGGAGVDGGKDAFRPSPHLGYLYEEEPPAKLSVYTDGFRGYSNWPVSNHLQPPARRPAESPAGGWGSAGDAGDSLAGDSPAGDSDTFRPPGDSRELQDTKYSKRRRQSPLARLSRLLAALVPLGVLVSALTPSVVSVGPRAAPAPARFPTRFARH